MSVWKYRSIGKGLAPRRSARPATSARAAASAAIWSAAVEALEDRRLMSVTLASNAAGGGGGNGPSGLAADNVQVTPGVSDDGRYVVFASKASNLVANDTNNKSDIFVKDLQTGTVTLVSSTPAGTSGNGDSGEGTGPDDNGFAISGNGRFVAFASEASDLVANDANGGADLFVKDLQTGAVTLVTVNAAGTGTGSNVNSSLDEGVFGRPAISDDGRFVAFSSDANDLVAGQEVDGAQPDTFVRDTQANTTTQLTRSASGPSAGNGSNVQSISGDGRYVVFVSQDEIVAGQGGAFQQVWLYDTSAKTFALVSVGADGTSRGTGESRSPRISADGRHVVFQSTASNLVTGQVRNPTLIGSDYDLFHRNLNTGQTQLVSRKAGTTTTGGNEGTEPGSISADGKLIAFYSEAGDIAAGVTDTNGKDDAFLFDTTTGALTTLSAKAGGGSTVDMGAVDLGDDAPAISENGKIVVFGSFANDIVEGDGNPISDLFAYDTGAKTTRRLLEGLALPGGADVFSNTERPAVSADGSRIAFVADGIGLPGNDPTSGTVPFAQVYVDQPGGGAGNPGDPDPGNAATIDVVPTITAALPAAVVAGQKAKAAVSVLVTNAGTGLLNGPVTVRLLASQDATAAAGDAEIATVTKKLKLRPGQSKAIKVKVGSFPTVADGDYFVVADVAGGAGVTEGNTSNNQAATTSKVTIAAPFVDLTGATNTPLKAARAGRKSTLVLDVTNAGNTPATGAATVRLTLAPQAGGGSPVTVDVPAKLKIKPGATAKLKLKFVVPADLAAGTYNVSADIDPANAVPEKNEANNAAGPVVLTVLA